MIFIVKREEDTKYLITKLKTFFAFTNKGKLSYFLSV